MPNVDAFYEKFLGDLPEDLASPEYAYEEQCVKAVLAAYKKENIATNGMWNIFKTRGFKLQTLRDECKFPATLVVADHGAKFAAVYLRDIFTKPATCNFAKILSRTREHLTHATGAIGIFMRTSDVGNIVVHNLAFTRLAPQSSFIVLPSGLVVDIRTEFCRLAARLIA